ncbi:DUF4349 domain-containing protein [Chitinophaga sp. Hz27]|uniref:DUF4349 domain-containing protein n=1 Tax=Chitinophaga sp. Hz27 TaxID=3347169 RepID=UPI0035D78A7E
MFNISRKVLKRSILICVGIFVAMFFIRLIYGYKFKPVNAFINESSNAVFNFGRLKNYASEKIQSKGKDIVIHDGDAMSSPAASQKYEKVARLQTKSNQYDKDESTLYHLIDSSESIIQFENKTGNKGERQLQLLVGVNPEKFDSFYNAAQRIGVVVEREVTKTDKTNEYQKLNAQRVSLEKTLASLNDLKNKSGKIEEYLQLHDKIYATETELQNLGVELGNFDAIHEFCSVKIYMHEKVEKTTAVIGVWTRITRALEWTIKYYACLMFGAAVSLIGLLVLVKILEAFGFNLTTNNKKAE